MITKKQNDELVNRLLEVITLQQMKEAEQHLKFLGLLIEEYQQRKVLLEHTKPFFFQYQRKRRYLEEVTKCEKKIEESYRKMERQTELIEALHDQLKK